MPVALQLDITGRHFGLEGEGGTPAAETLAAVVGCVDALQVEQAAELGHEALVGEDGRLDAAPFGGQAEERVVGRVGNEGEEAAQPNGGAQVRVGGR